MKIIKLTQNKETKIDSKYYDFLNIFKWHYHKTGNSGYARTEIQGKKFRMHTLLMNPKKNKYVDHINGNTLDNRIANLRECTPQESSRNIGKRKSGCSSKYVGVSYSREKKMWVSRISYNNKDYHLGYFQNEIDAAMRRDEVAIKKHGEFAKLNLKNI